MIRFLDLLLTSTAIIILLPLTLPVIFILLLTGEGQVFFIQKRVGVGGKAFGLIKFATMLKDSPKIGAGEITLKSDPRILPFGRLLRKSKINELPQLINVILGQMSLIGPRPMVPKTYAKYSQLVREHLDEMKPGLSGIGSIVFRDEEKYLVDQKNSQLFYDEVIIPYKGDLELWYAKNRSITVYLKLIILTILSILLPKEDLARRFLKGLPESPDGFEK